MNKPNNEDTNQHTGTRNMEPILMTRNMEHRIVGKY
jgi:hypothetical protein